MNPWLKTVILCLVFLVVAGIFWSKSHCPTPEPGNKPLAATTSQSTPPIPATAPADAVTADSDTPSSVALPLPRLVDLGAHSCLPCKMMEPILQELRQEYPDRLEVLFIDVQQNPHAARTYGIRAIPTQIFYDASGRERFRHEGFMAKQDILNRWKGLGIDLSSPVGQGKP